MLQSSPPRLQRVHIRCPVLKKPCMQSNALIYGLVQQVRIHECRLGSQVSRFRERGVIDHTLNGQKYIEQVVERKFQLRHDGKCAIYPFGYIEYLYSTRNNTGTWMDGQPWVFLKPHVLFSFGNVWDRGILASGEQRMKRVSELYIQKRRHFMCRFVWTCPGMRITRNVPKCYF